MRKDKIVSITFNSASPGDSQRLIGLKMKEKRNKNFIDFWINLFLKFCKQLPIVAFNSDPSKYPNY